MVKFGGGKKKSNGGGGKHGRFRNNNKKSSNSSSSATNNKRSRRDDPYHDKPVSRRSHPVDNHTVDDPVSVHTKRIKDSMNGISLFSKSKNKTLSSSFSSDTKNRHQNTVPSSSKTTIDSKQAYNSFLRLLRKNNDGESEDDENAANNYRDDNNTDDHTSHDSEEEDSDIERMDRLDNNDDSEEEDDNVSDSDDDDDDDDDDDSDDDNDSEVDPSLRRTKDDKIMLQRKTGNKNDNNNSNTLLTNDDDADSTNDADEPVTTEISDPTVATSSVSKMTDIFYLRYIHTPNVPASTTKYSSTTDQSTALSSTSSPISFAIPEEYQRYQPITDTDEALTVRKTNLQYESIDITGISSYTSKTDIGKGFGLSTSRLYAIKNIQVLASPTYTSTVVSSIDDLYHHSSSSTASLLSPTTTVTLYPPPIDIHQQQYHLKLKLIQNWLQSYGKEPSQLINPAVMSPSSSSSTVSVQSNLHHHHHHHPFTPLQYLLFRPMFTYGDIYFGCRTLDNARELRTLSVLHILNHILKARDIITDHDQKIREAHIQIQQNKLAKEIRKDQRKVQKQTTAATTTASNKSLLLKNTSGTDTSSSSSTSTTNPPTLVQVPEYHDQGFTRARVLVLLPLRHTALQFIRTILRLLPAHQVMNRVRFFKEFSSEDSGFGDDNEENNKDTTPTDTDFTNTSSTSSSSSNPRLSVAKIMNNLPLKTRQMLSDDENDEVTLRETNISSESPSGPVLRENNYPYNALRQGWPRGLRERYQSERIEKVLRKRTNGGTITDSDEEEDIDDLITKNHQPRRSTNGKPRKRKRADRTTRDAAKMAAESILGSTAAIENAKRQTEKAKRKAQKAKEAIQKHPPPVDWERTFAGNIDDDFRIGISINRKNVRLYSPFYESDILIASPLGLRRIIGGEGDHKRETDFLSSIEITLIDQADMMLHQNWSHIIDIFQALNNRPQRPGDTDFSRVRECYLTENQKFLRQTIFFSNYLDTDINTLFRKYNYNTLGGIMIRPHYTGTISQVIPAVRQTFTRIPIPRLTDIDDLRFQYFQNKILPEIIQAQQQLQQQHSSSSTTIGSNSTTALSSYASHLLIYVPSYFDYVRIRNALDTAELEFVTCSEYSEDKDISRARNRFGHGLDPIILITERFHYFRRLRIQGIHHILFYSPPLEGHFYAEFLNWIEDATSAISSSVGSNGGDTSLLDGNALSSSSSSSSSLSLSHDLHNVSSTCLFTKYDSLALERIVGTNRIDKMINTDSKPSFVFV